MKAETILGAFIAALIGFGTGLLALLQQPDATVSGITQTAWVVLAVGSAISFLKDFQAISTRRALTKVTGGQITQVLAVLALMPFLVSCAGLTPNKTAEITVDSILVLSAELDMAERRDWISNEREDELQNKLIDALKILRTAYVPGGVAGCPAELTEQECLQIILREVEEALREAEQ